MGADTPLKFALTGRYDVEREIGAGGMATVYLARDVRHQRHVALKVLRPELGAVLGVERFLSEIRVTANLQHPNLLPLFDSGEADGLLFYVMPFVQGESLRSRLDREKQLPVDEAIRITVAVASALDYAHRHGVIHRDLKPENILMNEGQPLVADFGIALAVSNAGGNRITQTGLSLGTPHYMSPEQATGDRTIDARSDIYSLGAVLYEMLTGEPPHTGNTAQAVIARVLTESPRAVRLTRPHVPEHVEAALEYALEKLPADRFQTAAQFADALQGRSGGTAYTSSSTSAGTRAAKARRSWRNRVAHPLVIAAAAAGVTAIAMWFARLQRDVEQGFTVRFPLAFSAEELDIPTGGFVLSPDGRTLVYTGGNGTGQSVLYARDLNQLTSRVIVGTEGVSNPTFSPDGRWVAFLAQAQLRKVMLSGGAVIPIASGLTGISGMAWTPDDNLIFSMNQRLQVVPASGGTSRPLFALDTAGTADQRRLTSMGSDRGPRVLADGRTLLFMRFIGSFAGSKIGIMRLPDGDVTVLDVAGSPLGMLDDQLLYVNASGTLMATPFDLRRRRITGEPMPVVEGIQVATGGLAFVALSNSGSLAYRTGTLSGQVMISDARGNMRPLIAAQRDYAFPRLSPDGKRLAITIGTDLWVYDIASATPTRLTTEGMRNDRAEWSPDGTSLYFTSTRGSPAAAWTQRADLSGGATVVEEKATGQVDEVVISPDGATLVFRGSFDGHLQDIWYRRVSGDTARKFLASTSFVEYGPRFSPDGKWVAYSSDHSGSREIYVQPFPPTGAVHQVTAAGGASPVWSKDGRRIYFVDRRSLYAATIALSPGFTVMRRDSLFQLACPTCAGTIQAVHANYDVDRNGNVVFARSEARNARTIIAHDWKYELKARTRRAR